MAPAFQPSRCKDPSPKLTMQSHRAARPKYSWLFGFLGRVETLTKPGSRTPSSIEHTSKSAVLDPKSPSGSLQPFVARVAPNLPPRNRCGRGSPASRHPRTPTDPEVQVHAVEANAALCLSAHHFSVDARDETNFDMLSKVRQLCGMQSFFQWPVIRSCKHVPSTLTQCKRKQKHLDRSQFADFDSPSRQSWQIAPLLRFVKQQLPRTCAPAGAANLCSARIGETHATHSCPSRSSPGKTIKTPCQERCPTHSGCATIS